MLPKECPKCKRPVPIFWNADGTNNKPRDGDLFVCLCRTFFAFADGLTRLQELTIEDMEERLREDPAFGDVLEELLCNINNLIKTQEILQSKELSKSWFC